MTKQAVIVCDFQKMIYSRVTKEQVAENIANTVKVLEAARKKGTFIVHVVVAFRKGHPEIHSSNVNFSKAKANNFLVLGSDAAEELEQIRNDEECLVVKRRVSAFGTTDLQTILRSQKIEEVVLAGMSTSGVILSSALEAGDLDYKVTILEDCCGDTDPEIHTVLTKKVFVNRGFNVTTASEFIKTLE